MQPASGDQTARVQTVIAQAAAAPPPAPEPSAGSRRWEVKEGIDGAGETVRAHIFVAASAPGLTTGLIVTTTRRTYYLTCQSVKTSPIRVLRWHYPRSVPEPSQALEPPGLFPDPASPARYHVGYQVESQGRPPDWMPRHVVDDGKKCYIVYPEVTLFGAVPVVRKVGPNGPQLVNARQYLNVVILDELVAHAELRVGLGSTAEQVTITRGALRIIDCPGDAACPVWPQAAGPLARRTQP
jgi:type IV secretion system protein VirB9